MFPKKYPRITPKRSNLGQLFNVARFYAVAQPKTAIRR